MGKRTSRLMKGRTIQLAWIVSSLIRPPLQDSNAYGRAVPCCAVMLNTTVHYCEGVFKISQRWLNNLLFIHTVYD